MLTVHPSSHLLFPCIPLPPLTLYSSGSRPYIEPWILTNLWRDAQTVRGNYVCQWYKTMQAFGGVWTMLRHVHKHTYSDPGQELLFHKGLLLNVHSYLINNNDNKTVCHQIKRVAFWMDQWGVASSQTSGPAWRITVYCVVKLVSCGDVYTQTGWCGSRLTLLYTQKHSSP